MSAPLSEDRLTELRAYIEEHGALGGGWAEVVIAEIDRLRTVIRTGGAMYRAERVILGVTPVVDLPDTDRTARLWDRASRLANTPPSQVDRGEARILAEELAIELQVLRGKLDRLRAQELEYTSSLATTGGALHEERERTARLVALLREHQYASGYCVGCGAIRGRLCGDGCPIDAELSREGDHG